ncbi:MAG: restriction endonuclease subunit S, partial [Planctomycetota bacterium]|nr:restriction endonuclease subunit S [Planctomycetota bacterium]
EYTDTREPWLGAAPSHWQLRRAKYVLSEIDNRWAGKTGTLLSVSQYTGVTKRRLREGSDEPATRSATLEGYKVIAVNDLAVNIMLAWNGSLGVSPFDGVVSPAYCVYRFRSGDPQFFHHLLRSPDYRSEIKRRSRGVVESRLRLYSDDLFRMPLLLPPPAEQAGIVRFLGAVDRKVNRFIRAKRRLIEVLNEQKQAIITHAVTKGLNPSTPQEPSGIDWLGDVPGHWEVRKLRFLVDTLGGMTPSKANQSFWNGDVPWVSPKDMKSVEIVGSIDHITQAALAQTNITLIPSPAVLIVVRGMILARTFPVGVTTLPVTINQDMKALRPRNSPVGVNALYLRHLLSGLGDVVKMLIEESGHGTRVLRTDLWRNLPLPVPPRSEQTAICEFITDQTAVFDQASIQARHEIDLIREYRTRLVADVVTGKLDVRAVGAVIADESTVGDGDWSINDTDQAQTAAELDEEDGTAIETDAMDEEAES